MTRVLSCIGAWVLGASASDTRSTDLRGLRLVALILWRLPFILLVIGWAVEPWRGPLWTAGFSWIGASCTANAIRCARTHCALMGPLFLLLGIASAAKTFGVLSAAWNSLGLAGVASVLIGYVPEWLGHRYLRPPPDCEAVPES